MKVVVVDRERVFRGYLTIDRLRVRHERFSGGLGPELVREVVDRGQVAAVLPYDPDRDEVVLIEQFRPGALAAGIEDPWLIEIVAGVIEHGEDPASMVRREALEEAGCVVTDLVPVCRFLTSPGVLSETITLFLGRIDATGVGGLHGLADEGEDIRVRAVPADEAIALLDQGRIVNAKTVIALSWLARHRGELRRTWPAADSGLAS
jgi:ADP-ribose pyrophosphatase